MKNSVKKIFAAIAATAMCAIPMTGAMSANAAVLPGRMDAGRLETGRFEPALSDFGTKLIPGNHSIDDIEFFEVRLGDELPQVQEKKAKKALQEALESMKQQKRQETAGRLSHFSGHRVAESSSDAPVCAGILDLFADKENSDNN